MWKMKFHFVITTSDTNHKLCYPQVLNSSTQSCILLQNWYSYKAAFSDLIFKKSVHLPTIWTRHSIPLSHYFSSTMRKLGGLVQGEDKCLYLSNWVNSTYILPEGKVLQYFRKLLLHESCRSSSQHFLWSKYTNEDLFKAIQNIESNVCSRFPLHK